MGFSSPVGSFAISLTYGDVGVAGSSVSGERDLDAERLREVRQEEKRKLQKAGVTVQKVCGDLQEFQKKENTRRTEQKKKRGKYGTERRRR